MHTVLCNCDIDCGNPKHAHMSTTDTTVRRLIINESNAVISECTSRWANNRRCNVSYGYIRDACLSVGNWG